MRCAGKIFGSKVTFIGWLPSSGGYLHRVVTFIGWLPSSGAKLPQATPEKKPKAINRPTPPLKSKLRVIFDPL